MAAAINSSDAESRFFLDDKIEILCHNLISSNKMYSTQSTYFFQAKLSEADTYISKDSQPFKLSSNLTLLEGFKHLKDNWNGYGAGKFHKAFIEKVKELLLTLERAPKIFPTGRNSIQFEFKKKNGDYIEYEIYENGNINFLRTINDEDEEGSINKESLNEHISSFYAV